ncbi:MAG: SMC-Scp complex subunit ScpB [Ruminococcaceae bacterium]|nr:SMC-Scp complex subunit ScpB [Oscillospiraceae bacterium]
MSQNVNQCRADIEAILFASGEPMSVSRIAQAIEVDEETVKRLCEDLRQEYEMRKSGIHIVALEDAYQFCTVTSSANAVRAALELRRNTPLSQAALEVLAVIAYNQPVTKAFVEQVRSVDCGAVIQGLMLKGLVEERGRLELPGRPLLYGTTANFLRSFGLQSLEDLPPLPEEEQQRIMTEPTLDDVIRESEEGEHGETDET